MEHVNSGIKYVVYKLKYEITKMKYTITKLKHAIIVHKINNKTKKKREKLTCLNFNIACLFQLPYVLIRIEV